MWPEYGERIPNKRFCAFTRNSPARHPLDLGEDGPHLRGDEHLCEAGPVRDVVVIGHATQAIEDFEPAGWHILEGRADLDHGRIANRDAVQLYCQVLWREDNGFLQEVRELGARCDGNVA